MPRTTKKKFDDGYELIIQQNIVKYRKVKGLTQQELADLIGLSRSGLTDIELGKNNVYGVTIVRIAKALGISADTLLGLNVSEALETIPSLRFLKRLAIIETFPEAQKKRILRNLDDAINSHSKKTGAEPPAQEIESNADEANN